MPQLAYGFWLGGFGGSFLFSRRGDGRRRLRHFGIILGGDLGQVVVAKTFFVDVGFNHAGGKTCAEISFRTVLPHHNDSNLWISARRHAEEPRGIVQSRAATDRGFVRIADDLGAAGFAGKIDAFQMCEAGGSRKGETWAIASVTVSQLAGSMWMV